MRAAYVSVEFLVDTFFLSRKKRTINFNNIFDLTQSVQNIYFNQQSPPKILLNLALFFHTKSEIHGVLYPRSQYELGLATFQFHSKLEPPYMTVKL